MTMWYLWKERSGRIFCDKSNNIEKVWQKVKDNLLSSIRSMQWHDEDKLIPTEKIHIMKIWGIDKTQMVEFYWRDRIIKPSSPNFWLAPPPQVFKLNFDGASMGNPGDVG